MDPGDRQRDQPVEELPPPVAPEGDLDADGVALPQLEAGDRLLGPGHQRLLAGDLAQVGHRPFQQGGLLGGLTDTAVDDDLRQPGDLHRVGEPEGLLQLCLDHVVVAGPQAGLGVSLQRLGGHQTSPWHLRQMRVFLPASSMR